MSANHDEDALADLDEDALADLLIARASEAGLDRLADRLEPRLRERLMPLREGTDGDACVTDERERMLDAQEAAVILNYTPQYVLWLRREGALHGTKPPGRKYVRFRKDDVGGGFDAEAGWRIVRCHPRASPAPALRAQGVASDGLVTGGSDP